MTSVSSAHNDLGYKVVRQVLDVLNSDTPQNMAFWDTPPYKKLFLNLDE